jgi:hypothetical protein
MSQSRFFQLSLLFPFVVWCLYVIISSLLNSRGITTMLTNIIGAYPIFIPYFIFAALLWKLSGRKAFSQLVIIALISPVLWGFFYTLSHMAQYYFKTQILEPLSILGIMVFWATAAGYVVEALPLIALTIFKDDLKSG